MTIIQTTKPLRERQPEDFYPTPAAFVGAALDMLPKDLSPTRILDPGAGTGAWGMTARQFYPQAKIAGIELVDRPKPVGYDYWINKTSFLEWQSPVHFDLVIGNPPYRAAEEFIRHAMHMLHDGGYMVMLLRLAFLESAGRVQGLWKEYPPKKVGVYAQRPSFFSAKLNRDGSPRKTTDSTAYASFVWKKGWSGDTVINWLWVPDAEPTGVIDLLN